MKKNFINPKDKLILNRPLKHESNQKTKENVE